MFRSLRQVSAGGVVFKRSGSNVRICLIGRKKDGRLVWCLPKGHVEAGESFEQAALREVKEETGITSSILSPLGFITYWFYDLESSKRIFKTVHFFLARYLRGKLADHDEEVEDVRWFPVGEALRRVEYPSEHDVLKKAVRKLGQL